MMAKVIVRNNKSKRSVVESLSKKLNKAMKEEDGKFSRRGLTNALRLASGKDDVDDEVDSILSSRPLDTVIDALDPDVADTLEGGTEEDQDTMESVDPTSLQSESLLKKSSGQLDEAKQMKLNEESYRNIMIDYVKNGGQKNLDDFLAYAAERGYEPKPNDLHPDYEEFKFKKTYREVSKLDLGTSPNVNPATGAATSPVAPKPDHVNSDKLNSLIAMVGEADDHVATAAETVNEKFRLIKSKVRRVLTGKSLKQYYLLFGDAGIGKSYLVNECLEEVGLKGDPRVYKARGDLGASASSVASFLYKNKDRDIIILDDCDSMVMKNVKGNVSNMLKGALDPDGHEVTISPTIQKAATALLGIKDEGDDDEGEEAIVDDDGVIQSAPGVDETELEGGLIPQQFDWSKPKMIMISNANETNINEALLSRCDWYCLHLTQEEYLVRLAIVIKNMKFDNPNYTQEQYDETKNIVYSVLVACIEAANAGVSIGGIQIKLTHSLEFRLIRTLVDAWLARVEDLEFGGMSHEEAMKKAYRGFVKFDVAPLL